MNKSTTRNTLGAIRHTIPPRCDNCFFSIWAMGANRPMLGCRQRVNFVGRWRIVQLEQSCTNFYPSGDFKLGSEAVRRIPLTRGKFALVDAEDYYQLSKYQWHATANRNAFYAARYYEGKSLKIHRVIMAAPEDLYVDHIDHNGLNNVKSNLRLCTPAQNSFNKPSRNGASKYKGIKRDRYEKKWTARVHSNNITCHLGTFDTEIEAARAYDKKAAELHGEFACLNFPLPRAQRDTGMTGEKMNIQQFSEGYHLGRKLAAQHRRKRPAVDGEFFNRVY